MIVEECKVGLITVNRILKKFRNTGSFSPKREGTCNCKKKTTNQADRLFIRKSKKDPRLSSVDLNREMKKKSGVDIHMNTVKRRLYEVDQRAYTDQ